MTGPMWWHWELEITPHVEKRMEERNFTEIDLRDMLDRVFEPDEIEVRYMIQTRTSSRRLDNYC